MLGQGLQVCHAEGQLILHESRDRHAVCGGGYVGDGAVVAIVAGAQLGDEAATLVSLSTSIFLESRVKVRYLETSVSNSGSRFSGFSAE